MPSSRSDSRPSSIASANRFRWVRLRTCTAVASARSSAVGPQPLDRAVLLVRLVQAPQAVQGGVAAGVHLDQRGGLARVDQPQRGGQQRVHQRVVADQRAPGRRRAAAAPPPDAAPRGRRPRRPPAGTARPRPRTAPARAASRRAMASCRSRRRCGSSPPQDRLADPVVAEPHRLSRPGLDHQQALVEGGRQRLRPPRRPARRSRSAAGSARPARPGTPSPPPAAATRPAAPRPGAASSRPASDRPRCARTAAASHRHPPAVAVSTPSRRSALSSSTVSYGLPGGVRVDHLDQVRRRGRVHVQHLRDHGRPGSARAGCPAAGAARRPGPRQRDSSAASGCAASTSSSR